MQKLSIHDKIVFLYRSVKIVIINIIIIKQEYSKKFYEIYISISGKDIN